MILCDNKTATKSPPKNKLDSPVRNLRQLPTKENQIPPSTNGIPYTVAGIIATLGSYQYMYRPVACGTVINRIVGSGQLKGGRSNIHNIIKRFREGLKVNTNFRPTSSCPVSWI